jgi:hypothetical protein
MLWSMLVPVASMREGMLWSMLVPVAGIREGDAMVYVGSCCWYEGRGCYGLCWFLLLV